MVIVAAVMVQERMDGLVVNLADVVVEMAFAQGAGGMAEAVSFDGRVSGS